ncbi:hypothetical protein THASP1DRAFT_23232 [Thamnocephalis sphaerospora]|uniref:Tyrosinase copper-binding domain-containing protein n=1 Tax=Thamnocephalis sphaerospora TaxID=78915 RepID=A0A4P9XTI0_9FUNG|nr:hypothetical protein THASP1DRAFT_23232 [Thamnocephalis sphaerospora]|eukprot:RKP08851.1 hypothetical protein THASP1DRAFT_23232 [Thamnocephalis sphaerospora]
MRLLRTTALALVAAACTLIGAGTTGPQLVAAQGCRVLERQELRSMPIQRLTAFFRAVQALQARPRPNVFDWYAFTHNQFRVQAHGNAQFLAWHRIFIRSFEYQLQLIDPDVALPYWDWSIDSQAPETSWVLSRTWFGGNGRSGDNCVVDGQFANFRIYYPQQRCLQRQFNLGNRLGAFYSPEALLAIANRATDYATFNAWTEAPPHNIVHSNIAGDMDTMYSPNDPLFFVHHSFVDRQWAQWQARSQQNLWSYNGRNSDGSNAQLTDMLQPFNTRARDVMDTRNLCYTYTGVIQRTIAAPASAPNTPSAATGNPSATASATNTPTTGLRRRAVGRYTSTAAVDARRRTRSSRLPDQGDRSDLNAIRACKPIPEENIRMNFLDRNLVRSLEAMLGEVAAQVNSARGYVSPSALISRPQTLAALGRSQNEMALSRSRTVIPIDVPKAQDGSVRVDALVNNAAASLGVLDATQQQNATASVANLVGSEGARVLRSDYGVSVVP